MYGYFLLTLPTSRFVILQHYNPMSEFTSARKPFSNKTVSKSHFAVRALTFKERRLIMKKDRFMNYSNHDMELLFELQLILES